MAIPGQTTAPTVGTVQAIINSTGIIAQPKFPLQPVLLTPLDNLAILTYLISGETSVSLRATPTGSSIAQISTARLFLDNSAGPTNVASSTHPSISLTTSNANDLILFCVVINNNTTTVNSVSGGGLTWLKRVRVVGASLNATELWYAIAPLPLSNVSITATLSSGAVTTLTAVGISGANTTTPFDPNVSLPGTATASSTAPSATISTSNPNDFIICFVGGHNTLTSLTPPAFLTNNIGEQIAASPWAGAAYQVVSALQTNLALTWSDSTSEVWQAIADAIQGAAPPEVALSLEAIPTARSLTPGRSVFALRATPIGSSRGFGETTLSLRATPVGFAIGAGETAFSLRASPTGFSRGAGEAALSLRAVSYSTDLVYGAVGNALRAVVTVGPPPATVQALLHGSLVATLRTTSKFTGEATATLRALPVSESIVFTPQFAPIAIDGYNAGSATSSLAVSTTLTTVNATDVIIAFFGYAGAAQTGTSVSGGGLTWVKRKSTGVTEFYQLEEWYAITSSPLSSATITATLPTTAENSNLEVFGIQGANTTTPFDPNTTLPAVGASLSEDPHATISTSHANDILFTGVATGEATGATLTAPTNFTAISLQPAPLVPMGGDAYEVVSATQTSLTVTWTISDTSLPWVDITDAIQAAPVTTLSLKATPLPRSLVSGRSTLSLRAVPLTMTRALPEVGLSLRAVSFSTALAYGTVGSALRAVATVGPPPAAIAALLHGSLVATLRTASKYSGTASVMLRAVPVSESLAVVPSNPVALDGYNAVNATTTLTVSANLTTVSAPDVIIAFFGYQETEQSPTSVSGGGLTWIKRKASSVAAHEALEEWYAIANSPLLNVTITASLPSTAPAVNCNLMVFGIQNANTTSPFDPNSSLPAAEVGISETPYGTISTSNPNDFLFTGWVSDVEGGSTITGPPNLTVIDLFGSTISPMGGDAYEVVSATQSNLTISWKISTNTPWVDITDAVQARPFTLALHATPYSRSLVAGESTLSLRAVPLATSQAFAELGISLRATVTVPPSAKQGLLHGTLVALPIASSLFAPEVTVSLRAIPVSQSLKAGETGLSLRAIPVTVSRVSALLNTTLRAVPRTTSKESAEMGAQLRATVQMVSRVTGATSLALHALPTAGSKAATELALSLRATPTARSIATGALHATLRATPIGSSIGIAALHFSLRAVPVSRSLATGTLGASLRAVPSIPGHYYQEATLALHATIRTSSAVSGELAVALRALAYASSKATGSAVFSLRATVLPGRVLTGEMSVSMRVTSVTTTSIGTGRVGFGLLATVIIPVPPPPPPPPPVSHGGGGSGPVLPLPKRWFSPDFLREFPEFAEPLERREFPTLPEHYELVPYAPVEVIPEEQVEYWPAGYRPPPAGAPPGAGPQVYYTYAPTYQYVQPTTYQTTVFGAPALPGWLIAVVVLGVVVGIVALVVALTKK